MSAFCSRCGELNDRPRQRYCKACHSVYQAAWRKKATSERRFGARLAAGLAKRFGDLRPQQCIVCGSAKAEMHHPDHELEYFVVWLCRDHHMAWHKHWKETVASKFAEWVGVARACANVQKAERATKSRKAAA